MFTDADLIHSYSRREAIEDGVLIDVSETAREAGFRFPVALTAAAWGQYVEVPPGVACQDEAGRLWDVLWMTRHAIAQAPPGVDTVAVKLYVRNTNGSPEPVTLKAAVGPGDDAEPVITIMLPDED